MSKTVLDTVEKEQGGTGGGGAASMEFMLKTIQMYFQASIQLIGRRA